MREPVAAEVGAWRRYAVLGLMALCAGVVLSRAFELQVLQRDFLKREHSKRAIRTLPVQAHRGAIRDRNGEPLALSAPVESIWAVPGAVLEAPEYLPALAKLLEMKPRALQKLLQERHDKQFVYLRRHLSPDDASRILALKAPGVFASREYRRYYPAGEVTSHLVGFCDIDGRGQEGMEAADETGLAGVVGSRTVIRDANGRIVEDGLEFRDAQPGRDLGLSIDLRLQYLAYRELKAAVMQHGAKGGLVLIADSRSGDVLAIANQPGFNPNRPEDRASAGMRNRAAVDLFEPGSSIKPLLLVNALESGRYRADTVVDTAPGEYKVGRLLVRDVHPHGLLDLSGLLSKSSNVGAAKIGLDLGPQALYASYQRFGIGEPIAVGFPGEAVGVLRDWKRWGEVATATAAYGYGLSVTALHLVRAYAAMANDGLMPRLHLTAERAQVPPERVASAQSVREVRQLMEAVVTAGGTGTRAAVPGYRVAGKTGTVRKPSRGGYSGHRHQALFIGMIPAEQPRLVGLVMLDEPTRGGYYGGQVAAPVFSRVMQGAARLLQLPPDRHAPAIEPPAPESESFAEEPAEPPLQLDTVLGDDEPAGSVLSAAAAAPQP